MKRTIGYLFEAVIGTLLVGPYIWSTDGLNATVVAAIIMQSRLRPLGHLVISMNSPLTNPLQKSFFIRKSILQIKLTHGILPKIHHQ